MLLSERSDPAPVRAELPIASRSPALEKPSATGRRGTTGAADETGSFAGEALPECGAQIKRAVTEAEGSAVAVHSRQVKRRAGEVGCQLSFEEFAATRVSGDDSVPQVGSRA
jgi:hypothetical protein